jgi:hypothetical protein
MPGRRDDHVDREYHRLHQAIQVDVCTYIHTYIHVVACLFLECPDFLDEMMAGEDLEQA